MKGTVFQKPLEFNLRVDGESWRQGDAITGTLVIRNHGSKDESLEGIAVRLAHGELKKVHEKSPKAFDIISPIAHEGPPSLTAGQQTQFTWTFKTDQNCPISDSRGSLFLLYGKGEAPEFLGQLQLPVHADSRIEEFLSTLKTHFRFVEKSRRAAAKDRVEIKLSPPSSKEMSRVEQLALYFQFDGEALEVEYVFQVKKVQPGAAASSVTKIKKEFDQRFEPTDYRVASGRWNHERMESAINEVISPMSSGALL